MNDTDIAIARAQDSLREILTAVPLTREQKSFVTDSARALANTAYELLTAVPEQQRLRLGLFAATLAVAMLIGPSGTWEKAMELYQPSKEKN